MIKLNRPLIARQHLVQASRLGRGTRFAQEANRTLMTLPQNVLAPRRIFVAGKSSPFAAALQPTVIIFNASWCQPCQDMNDIMDQAKQKYGSKVKFRMVDVDDKANTALVEHYSIGPVPTTVFLSPNGDVVASQVGFGGMVGMMKGLQKILPAH